MGEIIGYLCPCCKEAVVSSTQPDGCLCDNCLADEEEEAMYDDLRLENEKEKADA